MENDYADHGQQKTRQANKALSNIEILMSAIYLLGGETHFVDTEDVAVKANEIAPGRFTWVKYPDQINIHNVMTHLWDAKSDRKGSLILGSEKEGWMLTSSGLQLAQRRIGALGENTRERKKLSATEQKWVRGERVRILKSEAYHKFVNKGADSVTYDEAEAFFRLNSYVVGNARVRKIVRVVNAFGDDPELGHAVQALAEKVKAGETHAKGL